MTNCPNCGAPFKGGAKCEYCGTVKQSKVKSFIKMTADCLCLCAESEKDCEVSRVDEEGITWERR